MRTGPDAAEAPAGATPDDPSANATRALGAWWGVIRPERRLALTSIALASVGAILEVAALAMLVPMLAGTASGSGSGGRITSLVESLGFHGRDLEWAALMAFGVLGGAAALSQFASSATASLVRVRSEAHLRKELTDRLLGMEWSAFVMARFGELANSLLMESSQVGAGVQLFLSTTGAVIVTLAFVALALLLSVRLTAVVVGFALLALLVLRPLSRRAESHTRGLSAATTAIANHIADVLGNLKFFRSTGSRGTARSLFARGYDDYAAWFQRTQVSPLSSRLGYELGAVLFIVAVLGVSIGSSAGISSTTLAFLAIFLRLSPRLRDLQEGLVRLRVQYPWLVTWSHRRATADTHQTRPLGHTAPSFELGLRFDHASFVFPGADRLVLDDVSWELLPGEVVAFVGESGAGKTTMLDLVTGLLTPTSGRIEVDETPLADLDLEEWQSHIGLVLQESPLFHGTVRENVVGGREVDDERVWACLAAAHAEEFVASLPQGLDAGIGERGGRLSGGQRQRLGLARALYRNPWLLVLDEATSALDSVSEDVVLEALRGLRGRVSMLVVAHRLATVEFADRIHVLEDGRLVQSGSWDELIQDAGGPFARMAAKQGLLTFNAS